jgi:hypothetical protein
MFEMFLIVGGLAFVGALLGAVVGTVLAVSVVRRVDR